MCFTSYCCCALILSVLIFHVSCCCDFFTNKSSMSCTSQTPAKFSVCYKTVALTDRIKLIRIPVLIYLLSVVMELKSSVDRKSDKCNTLEAISIMGEGKFHLILQMRRWGMRRFMHNSISGWQTILTDFLNSSLVFHLCLLLRNVMGLYMFLCQPVS